MNKFSEVEEKKDIIFAQGIFKSFPQGEDKLWILRGVDLRIRQGEALCIVGASGAGKSTLLHILGTLDEPDEGELWVNEQNILEKSEVEKANFRNENMGFVFQFHHLLQEFTAYENVSLPLRIQGKLSKYEIKERVMELLTVLNLESRKEHYPKQLSGGELQRVAIARALACGPKILFADEPTGNLDSQNGKFVQDLFFALHEKLGLTLVVVTHDRSFASRFSRVCHLADGQWEG